MKDYQIGQIVWIVTCEPLRSGSWAGRLEVTGKPFRKGGYRYYPVRNLDNPSSPYRYHEEYQLYGSREECEEVIRASPMCGGLRQKP